MVHNDRLSFIGILCSLVRCLILFSLATTAAAVSQNPVPLINQPILPDAIKPGGAGFTLTVNGTGFVLGSVVHWNGNARATTFVSSSQLKASVSSSDIAKAGTASVTVVNPSPGGGVSNVVLFEVTPSSSSIALSAPTDFSVGAGSNPASVAVGDFNGDGKLDLAVANESDDTVSVLLGNGDGTFRAAVSYGTGSSPYSVAVGDFNRDGKLDLAVANRYSNNVSVLLGIGDGTFQAAVEYVVGAQPLSVAVGDFNRDGKLDLAVANFSDNNVSVLLGNGDGTFQASVNYNAGAGPISTAVGDLNRDGKMDLAVANSYDNVSVLLGDGDGTFQAPVDYAVGAQPASVAIGDFNGDAKLDLAVANGCGASGCGSGGSVSILLGNGDGTFQAHVDYGTARLPPSVAMGDFNRDGRLDVAVADSVGTTVSVLLQTPIVSLSKTSLAFADHLVGTSSPRQTVTLSNTSGLTLEISSITVTGTDPKDFSQTNACGSSVAPQGSCTITLTFTPTERGPRTASVAITDNAADSPQQIALSGTGVVSGANATLSPTSLTFTTQLVGTTSPAQSVTLSDYGTATLNISSITITGANSGDFAQTNNCGSSMAPGASCTINVTFTPTQRGSRTATLSVADNAPGSPQTASLTGTGTVVEFNPTSLSFGSVKIGQSKNLTTTLTNTGSTTLSITSIAAPHPPFSQGNTCGLSVGAGKSCTVTVTFTPKTWGTFTGTVSVIDNGGGSPQQVRLSGTGFFQLR